MIFQGFFWSVVLFLIAHATGTPKPPSNVVQTSSNVHSTHLTATLSGDNGSPITNHTVYAPSQSPQGFAVDNKEAYWADISWNALVDKTGYINKYHVEICDIIAYNNCEKWRYMETNDETPFIHINNLTGNGLYIVCVAAANSVGVGPYSNWWPFNTYSDPPQNPPTNFGATLINGKVTTYWDPVVNDLFESKLKGYVVQYWHITDSINNAAEEFTTNTAVEFMLPKIASYNIWVRSVSDGGFGAPSRTIVIPGNKTHWENHPGGNVDTVHKGKSINFSLIVCFIFFVTLY